jgi:hypothetical protein
MVVVFFLFQISICLYFERQSVPVVCPVYTPLAVHPNDSLMFPHNMYSLSPTIEFVLPLAICLYSNKW